MAELEGSYRSVSSYFSRTCQTLAIVLLITSALSACVPTPTKAREEWAYADLLALDSADSEDPKMDLTAMYLRKTGKEWQVRLDFLDLSPSPNFDLYLAIDIHPGDGVEPADYDLFPADFHWDVIIHIPPSGNITAFDSRGKPVPKTGIRVVRDPDLDTITVNLQPSSLGPATGQVRLAAAVTPAGGRGKVDKIGPGGHSLQTLGEANVAMVFWNAMPAHTPVQAVRRWNGAHTGPYGGRHGLQLLLRATRRENIPLTLLDLKAPTSLTALDFVGGTSLVARMVAEGLLLLPEYAGDNPVEGVFLRESRAVSERFGFSPSHFIYYPTGSTPTLAERATFLFAPEPGLSAADLTYISLHRQTRILPVPRVFHVEDEYQATRDGPSLSVRTALSNAAQQERSLLILGGSLPDSVWGDQAVASAAFRWMRARPWIRFLNEIDMLNLPAGSGDIALAENPLSHSLCSPEEPLLSTCFSLYGPAWENRDDLSPLRGISRQQNQALLSVMEWAVSGTSISNCSTDPDGDGQAECILSSPDVFTLFELQGGQLVYAFFRNADRIHQFVAPVYQLDPLGKWDPVTGSWADDGSLPGSIYMPGQDNMQVYIAEIRESALSFAAPDGSHTKTFRLTPDGFTAEIIGSGTFQQAVTLAPDPWFRFQAGWSEVYIGGEIPGGWRWRVSKSGLVVDLLSPHIKEINTFNDPRLQLEAPEHPDREYPPGRFLPFPTAEVLLQGEGSIQMQIRVSIDS